MKALIFFIFYFCAASLMAALVSFPLYEIVGSNEFEFERWVARCTLLFLLLSLVVCMRFFNISLNSIGFNASYHKTFRQLCTSFAIGFFILGLIIFSLLYLDIRVVSASAEISFSLLLKALLVGLIIALVEETLFRGLFFTLASLWHGSLIAVLLSSFFYAILHFIKPIQHADQQALNFFSGFEVITNAFAGLSSMHFDDFLALFIVGVFLALVRLKTQSLIHCIGLHASWIFLIKTSKTLSDHNPLSDWVFLTGQYNGIIGLLSFMWLSIVSAVFYFRAVRRPVSTV